MTTLKGKHALVTGGSRGIGRGIALKLAAEEARVAVHYYQNEAAAKDTLDRVRKHGGDGLLVQADVSRPDEVRRMFAEVKTRFGSLDVFVAKARPELATFPGRHRPGGGAPVHAGGELDHGSGHPRRRGRDPRGHTPAARDPAGVMGHVSSRPRR
jgi:NAD(P)-dependent dehydrogenase (short-subunit alcohol dehydrogenase family)